MVRMECSRAEFKCHKPGSEPFPDRQTKLKMQRAASLWSKIAVGDQSCYLHSRPEVGRKNEEQKISDIYSPFQNPRSPTLKISA